MAEMSKRFRGGVEAALAAETNERSEDCAVGFRCSLDIRE